jgi:hypothetical protein
MDYAFDYFSPDTPDEPRTDFVYDERRSFSRMCLFCKYIGIVFYINTLPSCNKTILTVIMSLMFLSAFNSARYEFAHYRKYGTRFSSIAEFDAWKSRQFPKSRLVFSFGELGLKIWYGIHTFPPQFDFSFATKCGMGESVLKVHMLVLFTLYIIASIFSMYLIYSGCCFDALYNHHPAQNIRNHRQVQDLVRSLDPVAVAVSVDVSVAASPQEECCICLDKDTEQPWGVLPCAHTFHAACITRWVATQQPNCPICRFDMRTTV